MHLTRRMYFHMRLAEDCALALPPRSPRQEETLVRRQGRIWGPALRRRNLTSLFPSASLHATCAPWPSDSAWGMEDAACRRVSKFKHCWGLVSPPLREGPRSVPVGLHAPVHTAYSRRLTRHTSIARSRCGMPNSMLAPSSTRPHRASRGQPSRAASSHGRPDWASEDGCGACYQMASLTNRQATDHTGSTAGLVFLSPNWWWRCLPCEAETNSRILGSASTYEG